MRPRHPLADTYEQILREQLPNLLRLYLNPYVTQACFCLARYVQTTWGGEAGGGEDYQPFLANGFDEALSGAIKLARYAASIACRPTTGLVLDPADRLGPYASASVVGGGKVEFLPGLVVVGKEDWRLIGSRIDKSLLATRFGLLVLVAGAEAMLDQHADAIRKLIRRDAPRVIVCVDRDGLAALRRVPADLRHELAPDIIVFDESFVDHAVPFSAFTARKALYDHWNRPGKATFHSTTYQPNTISSLHFLRCLEKADPQFHASLAQDLDKIHADLRIRGDLFRRLYSPSLYRLIRATGFDTADVRAAGDFALV